MSRRFQWYPICHMLFSKISQDSVLVSVSKHCGTGGEPIGRTRTTPWRESPERRLRQMRKESNWHRWRRRRCFDSLGGNHISALAALFWHVRKRDWLCLAVSRPERGSGIPFTSHSAFAPRVNDRNRILAWTRKPVNVVQNNLPLCRKTVKEIKRTMAQ